MSEDTHLEPVKPKNLRLLAMIVVTVVSLVVMVVLTVEFWNFTIHAEVSKKQERHVPTQLANLRASEEGKLSSYEWVNQAEGVVRIPVARAMELTLRDWDSRPSGLMDSADKMALDAQKASPPPPTPPPGGATPPPAPAPGGSPPAPAPGGSPPAPAPSPAPTPPAPHP